MTEIKEIFDNADASLGDKLMLTIAIIILMILIRLVVGKVISRAMKRFGYMPARASVIRKITTGFTSTLLIIVLLGIWGVERKELTIFISSTMTVLAVGFVAQWSILSNITSSFIIFFNHPIKVGDDLAILDKDFPVEGRIVDIGIFFITLKTTDGEFVSTPSSVFMQKMIKRIDHKG